jgi:hypothetical protein
MSAQPDGTTAPSQEPEPIEAPPAAIRWRSWPAVERPRRTGLVAFVLLAAAVLVRWQTGGTVLALMALAALLAALWRYFLPLRFEVNAHGVERSLFGRARHVPWSAVARYEVCTNGMLLVPTDDDSPMSAFSGLFVPFADNREAVLLRLRYYLGPPARIG